MGSCAKPDLTVYLAPMADSSNNAPVAMITGAAGGLGSALVAEFLSQGWRVVAGTHQKPLDRQAASLWCARWDVLDGERSKTLVREVLDRWGRIDLLVNNAGVIADKMVVTLDESEWQRVIDVNLKGAFLCARAALRPMVRQRQGHIINVASFSGRAGAAGQANYAAAKAGLIGLTQSLAAEVGSRGISVNAILPGVLATPMTAELRDDRMTDFARANVLGRINTVDEIARFTAFLATLRNVSGQIFQLDSRIAPWS